jgi:hypothetical protein
MDGMKKWQVKCSDGITREIYLPECLEAVDPYEIPYYAAKWDFVCSWSKAGEELDNFLNACDGRDKALMEAWLADKEENAQ